MLGSGLTLEKKNEKRTRPVGLVGQVWSVKMMTGRGRPVRPVNIEKIVFDCEVYRKKNIEMRGSLFASRLNSAQTLQLILFGQPRGMNLMSIGFFNDRAIFRVGRLEPMTPLTVMVALSFGFWVTITLPFDRL